MKAASSAGASPGCCSACSDRARRRPTRGEAPATREPGSWRPARWCRRRSPPSSGCARSLTGCAGSAGAGPGRPRRLRPRPRRLAGPPGRGHLLAHLARVRARRDELRAARPPAPAAERAPTPARGAGRTDRRPSAMPTAAPSPASTAPSARCATARAVASDAARPAAMRSARSRRSAARAARSNDACAAAGGGSSVGRALLRLRDAPPHLRPGKVRVDRLRGLRSGLRERSRRRRLRPGQRRL